MEMINHKEDASVDSDESNRLSNEDLEALHSLQSGFQKCVVSVSFLILPLNLELS